MAKRDNLGRFLIYKRYSGEGYAIDEHAQQIVHMCEKYFQYLQCLQYIIILASWSTIF